MNSGKKLNRSNRIAFVAVALLLSALTVSAQSLRQISGSVIDEGGGAVVGATVSLIGSDGAVQRTTTTDSSGNFAMPDVAAGKHKIRVEKENFEVSEAFVELGPASPVEPLRIILHVAAVRQSITVSDVGVYLVPDATGATKTDTPIMETPVSVRVIPQQVLADQQIVRVGDALQNVSGVIPNNDSFGTNDSFTIRGFDQLDLTYEDGLRLDQYSNAGFPLDLANIESIEVVKGPASVLYGQTAPGGAVNIVTKRPLDKSHYSLQQQFGSYDFYRTTFDATGPLAGNLFYRFNLDYENADSFRYFVYTHEIALFPTIQWKIDERSQITAQFTYASGTLVTDNGIPLLPDGTPARVSIKNNYAEPDTNRARITQYSVKLLGSHEFSRNWRFSAAYKSGYYDSPVTNSVFYLGDADANGDLQRIGFTEKFFKHWTHQVVADLTGKFTIYGIQNTVLAGFDDYYQSGHYEANLYLPSPINIFNPIYGQPPILPPDPAGDTLVRNGQKAYGAYLQDQIALPGHLFLLAGLRFDRVDNYNNGYAPSTSNIHDRPSPTPRAGILWQPVQAASVYFSYSGNYGATPLGAVTADGRPLPPQSAQQYELGVKTEWLNGRLSATTSIYQITKQNIPTTDPSNPIFSVAVGEARSRGFELDVSGQITPNWKVIGGYSYIDSITTKDNNAPSLAGLRFPGAPANSGSFWSVYEIPGHKFKGLRFGAGVVGRTREVAYESPNGVTFLTDRIPGFANVNAMAAYTWHWERASLSAQLNISNLLDGTYFSAVNPSQAMPGAPISVIPAIRLDF
jgi:iron complex outermembrane recepter protein